MGKVILEKEGLSEIKIQVENDNGSDRMHWLVPIRRFCELRIWLLEDKLIDKIPHQVHFTNQIVEAIHFERSRTYDDQMINSLRKIIFSNHPVKKDTINDILYPVIEKYDQVPV